MRAHLVSLWIPCLGIAMPAAAQPSPPPQPGPAARPDPAPPPDKPAEAPTVESRLKALEVDLEDVKDENTDLKSEVADLKAQQAASKPPTSLSALNPQITAFLNGAVRVDDRKVVTPNGIKINNRPFLRTAELDFRAAVDPYADAVAILALEDEAGEGFGVDLEEGYVILKRLPILESAPLGLKLKLGRFRAPIGNVNRMHMHDMPWTTRPLPIARLLGTENGEFFESGFNPVGVDAEVILPTVVEGAVMEVNADVVDGGGIKIAGDGHDHPGFLGHYNLFFTLHDTHDFNLGLSGYYEGGANRAGLVSADALYKWKPLAAGEFHSVVLGGEVFYVDRRFALDTNGDGILDSKQRATPLAWYAFAQVQLSWHTYLGGRYDYVQDIVDKHLTTKVAAGYLTYYTSEFLRFRAGYEHRWSDLPAEDHVNSFLAEVNVVFGSHPTEPYWVNR
ncbi:MAG: hypothetical protein H6Q90_3113 [Deltaproteobacteria bacterium]|nr:hypothetical protein [Deltaproteobacteria bacterium]